MSDLTDDDIAILDEKASESLDSLVAYLDEVSGAADARQFGDKEGMRDNTLFHCPDFNRDALNSQDVDRLLGVLPTGCIMDRLVACLRILRIPESQLPANYRPDLMVIAQRHLSSILVEHPVLMHNRIMVKGMHFAKTEYGPIATIIAETPRAEFPRLAHGTAPERLKAFANHPCVRIGLTTKAPSPKPPQDGAKYQGLTMLGATVARNSMMSRSRMLTSLLELDAVRGPVRGRAANGSFLRCSGQAESDLRTAIANTFLSECGVNAAQASDAPESAEFFAALKSSLIPHQAWFLSHIEIRLTRWAALPAGEHIDGLRNLAHALQTCAPEALQTQAPSYSGTVQIGAVVDWLIPALLDSSTERAIAIGARFKSLPTVSGGVALGFIELMEELDPRPESDDPLDRMRRALGDQIGETAQVWLAAMRAHAMRKVIDGGRRGDSAPGETPRLRRSMSV
jgi:hypothetical protein